MFLGDRPAQHHAQPLHPAPPAGCFPCVVNKGACDAVFHERSEERSALHHVLVQARWRGSGDSLRAALGREDFQFLRTRLAVRCGHLSSIPLQWPSGPHPLREARIERYWPCVCVDSSIDFECLVMYVRVRSGSSTTKVRIRKFILHRSGRRYCYKVGHEILPKERRALRPSVCLGSWAPGICRCMHKLRGRSFVQEFVCLSGSFSTRGFALLCASLRSRSQRAPLVHPSLAGLGMPPLSVLRAIVERNIAQVRELQLAG